MTALVKLAFIIYSILLRRTLCDSQALTYVDTGQEEDEAVVKEEKDDESSEDSPKKLFIPEKDWKTIKPGEVLPPGLHVRINLQTGLKEAKLMDKDEAQNKQSEKEQTYDPQDLKNLLKSLKDDSSQTEEDAELVKKRFRDLDEIKREFSNLKIEVKSDTEIMQTLLERYKNATEDGKEQLLEDMEYILHQYDAAQDFVKMGGIQMIIPDLNSTSEKVRELVAFTLGSAMQGNPKVQIAVLQTNSMQQLLKLIALDQVAEVRARSLFALSCLVRNFPLAQKMLADSGGFSIFAQIFERKDPASLKLQLKVITLVNDLVTEQQLTSHHATKGDNFQKEKLKQYRQFTLLESLELYGFCSLIPNLLQVSDLDTQEKVITTMSALVDVCQKDFSKHVGRLEELAKKYKEEARLEMQEQVVEGRFAGSVGSNSSYFAGLHESVVNLISQVSGSKKKDEL